MQNALDRQYNELAEFDRQSSVRNVLVITFVIVAFFTLAFMFLPRGISDDLSVIGKGSNVAVLAHSKTSVQSLTLIELMEKVRADYAGRVKFIVADADTPEGRKFIAEQNVEAGSLLLFDADGIRRQVVSNINNQSILRTALEATYNN